MFFFKVAQVYRDRSIGNSINIVVVKIVFLETNEVWHRFFFAPRQCKSVKKSLKTIKPV